MKRTTVLLPDEVAAHLDEEGRCRDVPTDVLIREAVERYLMATAEGARLSFIGIVDSGGLGPSAAEVEQYLRDHWANESSPSVSDPGGQHAQPTPPTKQT